MPFFGILPLTLGKDHARAIFVFCFFFSRGAPGEKQGNLLVLKFPLDPVL